MQGKHRKQDKIHQWRQNNDCFYDFIFENFLDWPCTSVQWGPLLYQNNQFTQQRVYFSCRTDGVYNSIQNSWQNTPNYIVIATVQIPNQDHYFINDLKSIFNYDSAKKHPNLKIKQIITHPGEANVIRSSPANRKLLASKSQNNSVYLWTSEKYKPTTASNLANTPDYVLSTTKSDKSNYALKFSPSLPRIISASSNVLQMFDLESGPTKRQLGSVLSSNIIKPMVTLTGHDGVQDVAFKSNQQCISAGRDKQIGIWDLRVGQLIQKIKDIHQNDINCITFKGNYIISGGQEGRVNIIDDRKNQAVYRFEMKKPIFSTQFNPVTNIFGVGSNNLSIYSLDKIEQTKLFEPLFQHNGMRGYVNQFQWDNECSNAIISTCQQIQHDVVSHGGLVHIFRPLDLFFQPEDAAIRNLETAYNKLSQQEKRHYDNLQ